MSSICAGIIEIQDSKELLKNTLKNFIENNGWGIMFNSDSSIISNQAQYVNKMTFDLGDFPNYRNCERLLNADWSTYNGEKNRSSLKERLEFIREVIDLCLDLVESMEMYISDEDCTNINEFTYYEIHSSEFVDILMDLYRKIGFAPNVHLIIKK